MAGGVSCPCGPAAEPRPPENATKRCEFAFDRGASKNVLPMAEHQCVVFNDLAQQVPKDQ